MNQPVIIISAYNRSKALKTLLASLQNLNSITKIGLIISIDNNGNKRVNEIANNFDWPHGHKKVIIHEKSLGLINHFIWVGEQTKKYGNVIFLEDDLLVSPSMLSFATQLIEFYSNDPKVAAASLYNPIINETTGTKFYQINDGNDIYFLQQPYWGNIWFKDKWLHFSNYLKTYKEKKKLLPRSIAKWESSFKKIYIQYLIENDLYVVTPRNSLITNQCTSGLHSSGRNNRFHTNIDIEPYNYKLSKFNDSKSKYDAFLELKEETIKEYNPDLSEYSFDVDMNGTKNKYFKDYVLTSKPVKSFIQAYSSKMKPKELSVILQVEDDKGVKLCRREDVLETKLFYLKRRYVDIKNNYHIGINASIFILIDTFKYAIEILIKKFKKN